jgi:polyhydroxyalkanoate synthesis repressor PhaR
MVVKKYGNRRLYDTDESRYITLEELADRVRGGEHVTVVDAKTDKDLTQQTLAHIIFESRGAAKLLPQPLLEQLIRMGDDALAEFFGMYLTGSLELYLQARSGAQAMMPFSPYGPYANPFMRMPGWPYPGPGPTTAPARPAAPPPEPRTKKKKPKGQEEDTASQVAALRKELDAIKASLAKDDDE